MTEPITRDFQETPLTQEEFLDAMMELKDFLKEFCERRKVGLVIGASSYNREAPDRFYTAAAIYAGPNLLLQAMHKMELAAADILRLWTVANEHKN